MSYTKANICGVEYTAGHSIAGDKNGTCGSVVTCVIDGQSVYGKVVQFFMHICGQNKDLYAYVKWLNKTDYPTGTPLVVRVRDNAQRLDASIVSIFDIDPSRIIIERCDSESCYYMCRMEGFDTIVQV